MPAVDVVLAEVLRAALSPWLGPCCSGGALALLISRCWIWLCNISPGLVVLSMLYRRSRRRWPGPCVLPVFAGVIVLASASTRQRSRRQWAQWRVWCFRDVVASVGRESARGVPPGPCLEQGTFLRSGMFLSWSPGLVTPFPGAGDDRNRRQVFLRIAADAGAPCRALWVWCWRLMFSCLPLVSRTGTHRLVFRRPCKSE